MLTVRVDNPAWGTRTDIVPWGLADWWNYGGITGSVWLEASPPLHVVRADMVPYLDAADISVLVRHAGRPPAGEEVEPSASAGPSPSEEAAGERGPVDASVKMEVLPAQVTAENLTDQDVRRLVPGDAEPIANAEVRLGEVAPGVPPRSPVPRSASAAPIAGARTFRRSTSCMSPSPAPRASATSYGRPSGCGG